ncbi:MAG: WD40/YVTN/BNR-like repeat-containing protein [Limnohabitans sp.]
MKFLRCFFAVAVTAVTVVLAGCGGGKGSPAAAPELKTVTGEDGQITLDWTVVPGVQYRVYCAPGATVDSATVDNYSWYTTFGGLTRASAADKVLPPFTVDNVQNDTPYACTVDGRYNNGPAGPAAPSKSDKTRSAGGVWGDVAATDLGDLSAVTSGTLSAFTTNKLFAVGATGGLRFSDDYGQTWNIATPIPADVLTAVGTVNTAVVHGQRLYVAGSNGVLAVTSDLQSWITRTRANPPPPPKAIYKMVSNGSQLVAVGNGLISYSSDGVTWSDISGVPALVIRDVAYSAAGYWLAVGNAGTVLRGTTTGTTAWTAIAGAPSVVLNSVAALTVQTPGTSTYTYKLVAVGDRGAVGVFDGQNWSWGYSDGLTYSSTIPLAVGYNWTQVAAGQQILVQLDTDNSKIYRYTGGQFMVAGSGGALMYSGDAYAWADSSSWRVATSLTTVDTNKDAVSLSRYAKTAKYAEGTVNTYTWLLYDALGTGRLAR